MRGVAGWQHPHVAAALPTATRRRALWLGGAVVLTVLGGLLCGRLVSAQPGTVTATVGPGPRGVAIDASTNEAYIANQVDLVDTPSANPPEPQPATISAVNLATHAVVSYQPPACAAGSAGPVGVAVDLSGPRVYVTEAACNAVLVLNADPTTWANPLLATVAVGRDPQGIAVDQTTHHAFVANAGDNSVSVLDTSSSQGGVLATISAASFGFATPSGVAVDSATTTVYVTNFSGNSVTILADGNYLAPEAVVTSTMTNNISYSIGNNPVGVDVTTAGGGAHTCLYVANSADNTVSPVDVSTPTAPVVLPAVSGFAGPSGVVAVPGQSVAYVANASGNSVLGLTAGATSCTPTLGTPIAVGSAPAGVAAATPSGTVTLVVTNFGPATTPTMSGTTYVPATWTTSIVTP